MLNPTHIAALFFVVTGWVLGPVVAFGQSTVNLLRAPTVVSSAAATGTVDGSSESFSFAHNLILFEASIDGRAASFILDTGAPSLVVNNRGRGAAASTYTGLGAGGTVALTDHRIERFQMGGRSVTDYWALGVDLREMERRIGTPIDGFVGYDLLSDGELRIDYAGGQFQLRASERHPEHRGRQPIASLRFHLVDHLPVIRLRINGRRYAFAIDTGAGVNLVDRSLARTFELTATDRFIDLRGVDEAEQVAPVMHAPESLIEALPGQPTELVAVDLAHLCAPGQPLAGILGSAFLSQYTVGIDYRRRRIHFWRSETLE